MDTYQNIDPNILIHKPLSSTFRHMEYSFKIENSSSTIYAIRNDGKIFVGDPELTPENIRRKARLQKLDIVLNDEKTNK